jgi:hypothetical protein
MYCRTEWRSDERIPSFKVSYRGYAVVDKNLNLTIINSYDSFVELHNNSYPLDIAKIHYRIPSNELMNGLRR